MTDPARPGKAALALFFLTLPFLAGIATAQADQSTTYTITLRDDGSAIWQVEYRTPLPGAEDVALFNDYAANLSSLHLPRFRDLMERSAGQAAAATARPMAVDGFTGIAEIQTSPTGRYGVVLFSFTWRGFGRSGDALEIGDALAGGLYLAREDTLIIRYPPSYTVSSVEPAPDLVRDGLTWYGLRAFGAGEPRLVLQPAPSTWSPVLLVLGAAAAALAAAALFLVARRRSVPPVGDAPPAPPEITDTAGLEERILHLLEGGGGEHYQSEIVRSLGLPKSTVSAALNTLHNRGLIQKIRKGRENLIRLVR